MVRVYDFMDWLLLSEFIGYSVLIDDICFSFDGSLFVILLIDYIVKVWNWCE